MNRPKRSLTNQLESPVVGRTVCMTSPHSLNISNHSDSSSRRNLPQPEAIGQSGQSDGLMNFMTVACQGWRQRTRLRLRACHAEAGNERDSRIQTTESAGIPDTGSDLIPDSSSSSKCSFTDTYATITTRTPHRIEGEFRHFTRVQTSKRALRGGRCFVACTGRRLSGQANTRLYERRDNQALQAKCGVSIGKFDGAHRVVSVLR